VEILKKEEDETVIHRFEIAIVTFLKNGSCRREQEGTRGVQQDVSVTDVEGTLVKEVS